MQDDSSLQNKVKVYVRDVWNYHNILEEELTFLCHICGHNSQIKDLFLHVIKSHFVAPYTCGECDLEFNEENSLKEHLQTHINEWTGNVKPELQLNNNNTDDTSIKHKNPSRDNTNSESVQNVLHIEKPYACTVCDYRSDYKRSLQKHILTHMGERGNDNQIFEYFVCNKCDFKTSDEYCSDVHVSSHNCPTSKIEKMFICCTCGFQSSRNSNVERHILTHGIKKLHSCNACAFTTNRITLLHQNVKCNHSEALSFDDFVNKPKFEQKNSKVNTKEEVPSPESKAKVYIRDVWGYYEPNESESTFICHICGHKLQIREDLFSHVLRFHFVAPYICGECDLELNNENGFKEHLQTHVKESNCDVKPEHNIFKTDEMPIKGCMETSLMHTHKKSNSESVQNVSHDIEKPYVCMNCDYRFKYKLSLQKHILTHMDQSDKDNKLFKYFVCNKCDFKTSDECYAEAHISSHNCPSSKVGRLFVCSICGFQSKRKYTVQRHILIHSVLKPHSCNACTFTTNRIARLKLHVKRRHKKSIASALDSIDDLQNSKTKKKNTKFNKKAVRKTEIMEQNNNQNKKCYKNAKQKQWVCDMCGIKLKTANGLNMHKLEHLNQPESLSYVVDDSQYIEYSGTDVHMIKSDCSQTYTCGLCDVDLPSESDLIIHFDSHLVQNS